MSRFVFAGALDRARCSLLSCAAPLHVHRSSRGWCLPCGRTHSALSLSWFPQKRFVSMSSPAGAPPLGADLPPAAAGAAPPLSPSVPANAAPPVAPAAAAPAPPLVESSLPVHFLNDPSGVHFSLVKCFYNVVLHCLFHGCPSITASVAAMPFCECTMPFPAITTANWRDHTSKVCPINQARWMCRIIIEQQTLMQQPNAVPIRLNAEFLVRSLVEFSPGFWIRNQSNHFDLQQDATELWSNFVSGSGLTVADGAAWQDIVSRKLRAQIIREVSCFHCNTVWLREPASFSTILLTAPLPPAVAVDAAVAVPRWTIAELLLSFFGADTADHDLPEHVSAGGAGPVMCPVVRRRVTRSWLSGPLPDYLLFRINRDSSHPFELDISDPHVLLDFFPFLAPLYHQANGFAQCQYRLRAVMIHSGTADGGHYTCCVRLTDNSDSWWFFNDLPSNAPETVRLTHAQLQLRCAKRGMAILCEKVQPPLGVAAAPAVAPAHASEPSLATLTAILQQSFQAPAAAAPPEVKKMTRSVSASLSLPPVGQPEDLKVARSRTTIAAIAAPATKLLKRLQLQHSSTYASIHNKDATPIANGFKYQCLFTLSEVLSRQVHALSSPADPVLCAWEVQEEGLDDVSVLVGNRMTLFQVKNYKDTVAMDDFAKAFMHFMRIVAINQNHQTKPTKAGTEFAFCFVTIGTVEPFLRQLWPNAVPFDEILLVDQDSNQLPSGRLYKADFVRTATAQYEAQFNVAAGTFTSPSMSAAQFRTWLRWFRLQLLLHYLATALAVKSERPNTAAIAANESVQALWAARATLPAGATKSTPLPHATVLLHELTDDQLELKKTVACLDGPAFKKLAQAVGYRNSKDISTKPLAKAWYLKALQAARAGVAAVPPPVAGAPAPPVAPAPPIVPVVAPVVLTPEDIRLQAWDAFRVAFDAAGFMNKVQHWKAQATKLATAQSNIQASKQGIKNETAAAKAAATAAALAASKLPAKKKKGRPAGTVATEETKRQQHMDKQTKLIDEIEAFVQLHLTPGVKVTINKLDPHTNLLASLSSDVALRQLMPRVLLLHGAPGLSDLTYTMIKQCEDINSAYRQHKLQSLPKRVTPQLYSSMIYTHLYHYCSSISYPMQSAVQQGLEEYLLAVAKEPSKDDATVPITRLLESIQKAAGKAESAASAAASVPLATTAKASSAPAATGVPAPALSQDSESDLDDDDQGHDDDDDLPLAAPATPDAVAKRWLADIQASRRIIVKKSLEEQLEHVDKYALNELTAEAMRGPIEALVASLRSQDSLELQAYNELAAELRAHVASLHDFNDLQLAKVNMLAAHALFLRWRYVPVKHTHVERHKTIRKVIKLLDDGKIPEGTTTLKTLVRDDHIEALDSAGALGAFLS